jgi:hypothetical protein
MWRLVKPLDYLRIDHPEKRLFDWWIPILLGTLLSGSWWVDGFRSALFLPDGFISQLQSLLSILSGFFIAALAAVATFEGHSMDRAMPGKHPLTLHLRRSQEVETLSRRRFLCLMFGYLAFLSLALYFLMMLVSTFRSAIEKILDTTLKGVEPEMLVLVHWIFWAVYCMALVQLLTNTLLGLYYLTDRIHRGDGESIVGRPNSSQSGNVQTPAE